MKRKRYSCLCGFLSSDSFNPLLIGVNCPMCGRLIKSNLKVLKVKKYKELQKYPYADFGIDLELDISEKRRDEIRGIEESMDACDAIERSHTNSIYAHERREISKIESSIHSLKVEYRNIYGKYMAANGERKSEYAKRLASIEPEIWSLESKIDEVRHKYWRITDKCMTQSDNAVKLSMLKVKKNGILRDIQSDYDKYGQYISSIVGLIYNSDISYYDRFIDATCDISYEDDEYLKSICDEYLGKDMYMKCAKRLKQSCDKSIMLRSRSKAIEIIIKEPRTVDLDEYSLDASRLCFERFISDIAAMDGSINGFKI